jgi:putative copper resistance protein D
VETAAVLARAAQYLGAALLFGWPFFSRVVGALTPAPRLPLAGALLLAAGALVSLCVQTAAMVGSDAAAFRPTEVWLVLTQTIFGHGVAVRLVLAAALLGALFAAAPTALRLWLGAAIAASMALTGHAAAGEGLPGLAHQAADAVHMLAAAVWIGALLAFAGAVFDPSRAAETQTALARFAGLGSAVVATLILTGLVNSAILVTAAGVPHLADSAYGRWLLVKLGLFGLMLGLAAAHRFVLAPRLSRDLNSGMAAAPALKALRLSLAAETALGLAVLTAVAVLGRLPPVVEGLPAP